MTHTPSLMLRHSPLEAWANSIRDPIRLETLMVQPDGVIGASAQ